jgi:hypothetical protein
MLGMPIGTLGTSVLTTLIQLFKLELSMSCCTWNPSSVLAIDIMNLKFGIVKVTLHVTQNEICFSPLILYKRKQNTLVLILKNQVYKRLN